MGVADEIGASPGIFCTII